MTQAAQAVVWRYLAASESQLPPQVQGYGLEPLLEGKPVTLYHGTTRLFRRMNLQLSRGELNKNYYGNGLFFTPSKRVAGQYAGANRNIGFDRAIVTDLTKKNRFAGEFLATLVEHGRDGWDIFFDKHGLRAEDGLLDMDRLQQMLRGVNPNTLGDIAGYILGSKVKPLGTDEDPVSALFGGGPTGVQDYVYDNLDEVGLNSKVYRPKVYTVSVRAKKVLVTASTSEARRAKSRGYDCVIFYGRDLIDGVPEVAVYDANNVRIRSIQVVD